MAKSRTSGASYKTHGPKEVTNPVNGRKVTSYGEGWHNGYHVYLTDEYGGQYVDNGRVGKFSIGDKVVATDKRWDNDGTIIAAHIYPSGGVSYNVEFPTDRYNRRQQKDPSDLRKA